MKKLLNADLSFLQDALNGEGINAKPKFTHKMGISRRKKQIAKKTKEITDNLSPDEDYKEFSVELQELKTQFCDKDKNGKLVEEKVMISKKESIMVPVIIQKLELFEKKRDSLRKKYSKSIEIKKSLDDSYEEYMSEELKIKLAEIKFEDFVKELTSFKELYGLYPIINNYDKDKLLTKKIEIEITIKELFGHEQTLGLFNPRNILILGPIINWDLNVILAYNMRSVRELGLKTKEDKIYTDHFDIYEKERAELIIKHSKKSLDGEPIRNENSYSIKNMTEFNKEFNELKKKHKTIIDAYEKFTEKSIKLKIVIIDDKIMLEVDKLLETEELIITQQQSSILDYFVT